MCVVGVGSEKFRLKCSETFTLNDTTRLKILRIHDNEPLLERSISRLGREWNVHCYFNAVIRYPVAKPARFLVLLFKYFYAQRP